VTTYLPELEALKLALRTREVAEPVPHSRNRPGDAVQLSTSNLPQINWATVVTPKGNAALFTPPPPQQQQQQQQPQAQQQQQAFPEPSAPPAPFAVADDPFGLLPLAPQLTQSSSFGGTSSGGSPGPGRELGRSLSSGYYGASSGAAAAGASAAALSRHALFAPRPGPQGQAGAQGAGALPRPKYPEFERTPVPQPDLLGGRGAAAAAQPSAPALPAVGDLSLIDAPAMPRPSAGPSLGPQEVQVRGRQPGAACLSSCSPAPRRTSRLRPRHHPAPPGPQVIGVDPASALSGATCATCPPPPPEPAPQQPQQQQLAPAAAPAIKEYVRRAALRDVHISVALMEDFLRFAAANTRRGVESCGILAGSLSANDSVFTVTTLIMPKQSGTSDTVQVRRAAGAGGAAAASCSAPPQLAPSRPGPGSSSRPRPAPTHPPQPPTPAQALNEEEIFDVQFARGLYPLGWIHTHPTQTCFLSSIDMHTQCGYQTMLEEAVAVVMAPTDRTKKCGLFRLSTPGGLGLVQRCSSRGFHSHPATDTGQDIYELCGHVYLNPRTSHEVIDLR
jgi:STAM-binding protein